ncbi:MAG: CAP domain-containing protein [Myxococcota bacterium]
MRLRLPVLLAAALLVTGLAGCLPDGNSNVETCSDGMVYSSERDECVDDASHTDAGTDDASADGDDGESDATPQDTSADTGGDTGEQDTESPPEDTGPQCTAPQMLCGESCVDVQTSAEHCGDCDTPCAAPRTCQGGECKCPSGKEFCDGSCVDFSSDVQNCGGCGDACEGGYVCGDGDCHPNEKIAGVLTAVNEARSTQSDCGTYGEFSAVSPVSGHAKLHLAAQGHADDMADNDFFNHTGSDGSSFSQRISDAGYPGRPVGENIAAAGTDPASVVQRWMDSDGHCRNIMNGTANEIGVGFASNPSSQWGTYWVLKLGRR